MSIDCTQRKETSANLKKFRVGVVLAKNIHAEPTSVVTIMAATKEIAASIYHSQFKPSHMWLVSAREVV